MAVVSVAHIAARLALRRISTGRTMRVEQRRWTEHTGWTDVRRAEGMRPAVLVLYFGASEAIRDHAIHETLRDAHPGAHVLGCTTAGEICGAQVSDGTVVATAIHFEDARLRTAYRPLADPGESRSTGEQLAQDLDPKGLVHVFVLAEGLHVNGSELVKGLRAALPSHVAVTGGLAGDGDRFQQTMVCLDDHMPESAVAAVGFYGEKLRVGYGSMGGWDQFGPERIVTRSIGNVLYELDGSSALELYKTYLGPHAAGLPASGLLFPLSLREDQGDRGVVRTILGVDDVAGSLTFAGDVPQGSYVRLMKANVDRLIDGAHDAAGNCQEVVGDLSPEFAVLISCVGRKLVLKQRVEEEVESVGEVLGPDAVLSGFYSYGEIAPFSQSAKCELHNQTMTITTFAER